MVAWKIFRSCIFVSVHLQTSPPAISILLMGHLSSTSVWVWHVWVLWRHESWIKEHLWMHGIGMWWVHSTERWVTGVLFLETVFFVRVHLDMLSSAAVCLSFNEALQALVAVFVLGGCWLLLSAHIL